MGPGLVPPKDGSEVFSTASCLPTRCKSKNSNLFTRDSFQNGVCWTLEGQDGGLISFVATRETTDDSSQLSNFEKCAMKAILKIFASIFFCPA